MHETVHRQDKLKGGGNKVVSVMCIKRFGGAMSEKMRTAKEWLALGDELAVKLAEVFMPGPWKHKRKTIKHGQGLMNTYECFKCGFAFSPGSDGGSWEEGPDCPVPDPIVIDWNTAMEWRDKMVEKYGGYIWEGALFDVEMVEIHAYQDFVMDTLSQPKHYLIAAALAEGAKE